MARNKNRKKCKTNRTNDTIFKIIVNYAQSFIAIAGKREYNKCGKLRYAAAEGCSKSFLPITERGTLIMNKEQFRALSTKKRIMYVLSHVFWHGALAVIVCALAWAYVYEEYIWQPPLLNVEMIDAGRQTPDGEAFEAFLREEGCWGQGQRVDVSKAFQLGDEETDLKCNPGILLTCNILAEKTDLYFWDTNELEDQLKERALMDLREILPHRMLLEHAEDLVYTGPLLEGGYPCGIRLTHNSWIQKNQYYEQCMVGVSRTTKNMKMVRAFLEYLLRPDEMPGEIRPAHM